ncbi:glycosyltransferase family 9 protein [Desulfovibrio sp. OttesenSCG-928-F07]|nr:glycosyltransferase family 9 protein [Desulfovibrio sp. OttesenSCG-928-F07]
MNIVLINLTRFGDQLQSQAAINALASLNTEQGKTNKICLVCLPNFASSAIFLNNISKVAPLPRDGFLTHLEENWAASAADLWQWRNQLCSNFTPDMVCNLTPSVAGRLLGKFLAGSAPLTGFGLDEFGFATASPWAAFFQGSSRKRSVSPFNLVDLFRAVTGKSHGVEGDFALNLPEHDGTIAQMLHRESAVLAPVVQGFVAFQLGASEERRRWPVEYFAQLGNEIWNSLGIMPLLVGSAGEAELATRYATLTQSPHISLIGRTSLADLAITLKQCKLLVSNDTGTMHLAAGLNCPTLGIFLATAQPWDTGPYLVNSCSLEPGINCHPCAFGVNCTHNYRCRFAIPPSTVSSLCLNYLTTGKWGQVTAPEWPKSTSHNFNATLERPRVWLAAKDEHEFMNLNSLSGHENETRTLWFRKQRDFLRQFLDRAPNKPFKYTASINTYALPAADAEKLAAELTLLKAQLSLLPELGKMLLQKPLPVISERFMATLNKVTTSFENSAYMLALGLLWKIEIQENGDNLEQAILCIEQYFSLISSLLQELEQ